MRNRDLQAGVERQWQREYDERVENIAISRCCKYSYEEEGDEDGRYFICDKCNEVCNVIEL